MAYPKAVTLIEVGPRDGLQNEQAFVPTAIKIDLINQLSDSGLQQIEVTSFVSPKAIPQLADHDLVFQSVVKREDVILSALVPNTKGLEKALACGASHIAVFTAASEQFNQRNIHCSIAESLDRFAPVVTEAKAKKIRVRGYISCVLGCPYEGEVSPNQVVTVAQALLALGVDEISLGDTIGVGTPKQTKALVNKMLDLLPAEQMALHFHDTYGQAIANIYTALSMGISRFDTAVAGLGGCPYARGATGNVATEDVLYLMHGLGIETGVDIYKVVHAGQMICNALNKRNQSKVAVALLGCA